MKDEFDFDKKTKGNKLLINLGKVMLSTSLLGFIVGVEEGGIGEGLAIVGFIVFITLIITIMPLIEHRRFIKQIKNVDLDKLKKELANPNAKIYKPTLKLFENIYLLDNFIFQQGVGVANYKDIFWVYTSAFNIPGQAITGVHSTKQLNVGNAIILVLKNKQKVTIKLGVYYNNTLEIIHNIRRKNPDILVGNSAENRKKFKNIDNTENIHNTEKIVDSKIEYEGRLKKIFDLSKQYATDFLNQKKAVEEVEDININTNRFADITSEKVKIVAKHLSNFVYAALPYNNGFYIHNSTEHNQREFLVFLSQKELFNYQQKNNCEVVYFKFDDLLWLIKYYKIDLIVTIMDKRPINFSPDNLYSFANENSQNI